MKVSVIWHPFGIRHFAGPGHPESPTRLEAILAELKSLAAQLDISWEQAEPAQDDWLEAVHQRDYLGRLRGFCAGGGGRLGEDTVVNTHSYEAAVFGASAAVAAARSALAGTPAFAAARPPGHHATASNAMGFCLINNIVVASRWALHNGAIDRVLIIDWDVHHGNGTQALIERDPRIRYVSLHQWPLYPGTGREDERGVGNVFNVPRPPGLPRASYVADLNAAVSQAIENWEPELILISAGFDALAGDPLAGFTLEPDDYGIWLTCWRQLGVPMATVLEGGYDPARTARAAFVHLAALAGTPGDRKLVSWPSG
jgi:acetoin utilization deacetylase AcuC-like enzyme